MRLYGLLGGGGKYAFVCKACGKLGGSGGMFPREIFFFFDLLLDAIWWNLGPFFCTNISYHLLCH